MATISDLLAYAKSQARIESRDYFHPRYARADEVQAWRNDRAKRDRARRQVFRSFPGRIASNAELVLGSYGRLHISADGINYISGQHSALEIWSAVLAYFQQTNSQEG
jgi:hypothetical protein